MASVEYYFDEVRITDPNDFEKDIKEILDTLYAADGWILSALVPKGGGGVYIIICHRVS